MNNPQQAPHTLTERSGDILQVTDLTHMERYAFDPVTAVVWEHCDGRTSPERLIEIVKERFALPSDVAAELLWFTLDYLEKVALLADPVIGERFVFSRRQVVKILAAAGITLAIAPSIVSDVSAASAADQTMKSIGVFQETSTTEEPNTTTTTSTTTTTTSTSTTSTTTTTPDPAAATLSSVEAEPGQTAAAAGAAAAAAGLGLATWRKLSGKETPEQDEDAAQKGE